MARASAIPLIFIAALCLVPSRLCADGVYIPQSAYPAMPSIPVQRAMICFRGGVETLLVESAVQTPSPSVGWILPLPSVPTDLSVADAGTLTSVNASLRPQIVHDLTYATRDLFYLLLALVPFAYVFIRHKAPARRLWDLAILYTVVLLILATLLPSLSRAREASPGGGITELTAARRLGSYQVSVLSAGGADALSAWLHDNGLAPLPAAAGPIVDDYVRRNWCFLVARIRPDGADTAVPHPIAATFRCAAPVFPMKLTALADTTTRVELVVVADAQAAAEGFHREVADRFVLRDGEPRGDDNTMADFYRSEQTDLTIGSPDAAAWMWNGCTVTKLVGDLSPAGMSRDVEFYLHDLDPHRDLDFSDLGRRDITLIILLGGAIVELLAATYVLNARRPTGWPTPRQRRFLTGWGAAVLLAACVARFVLPVVSVRSGDSRLDRIRNAELAYAAHHLVAPNDLATGPFRVFQVTEFLDAVHQLRGTGELVREERSPGNFATRMVGGKMYFCVYDADGRELQTELPQPGKGGR